MMGMTGKLCLAIDQTPIINEVISPTPTDVAWATDFMADFEARGRVIRDGSDLPAPGPRPEDHEARRSLRRPARALSRAARGAVLIRTNWAVCVVGPCRGRSWSHAGAGPIAAVGL